MNEKEKELKERMKKDREDWNTQMEKVGNISDLIIETVGVKGGANMRGYIYVLYTKRRLFRITPLIGNTDNCQMESL